MSAGRKMACAGMFCALAVAVMMLGGLVPLATFCCPVVAAMALIPVFVECGERMAWAAWAAAAALSLMLCPDKEAALIFCFIGYYPILRWRLEQIRLGALRWAAKLGVFNLAIIAMYLMCIFVFQLDQVLLEAQEMGRLLMLVCLLIGNVTFLLCDRLSGILARLYAAKRRGTR